MSRVFCWVFQSRSQIADLKSPFRLFLLRTKPQSFNLLSTKNRTKAPNASSTNHLLATHIAPLLYELLFGFLHLLLLSSLAIFYHHLTYFHLSSCCVWIADAFIFTLVFIVVTGLESQAILKGLSSIFTPVITCGCNPLTKKREKPVVPTAGQWTLTSLGRISLWHSTI